MDRDRPPRFELPEKPVHPFGWNCSDCFHVVKDVGSKQMKCCAHPPTTQALTQGAQFLGALSVSPPVNDGEWCGEYMERSRVVRGDPPIEELPPGSIKLTDGPPS
jgi:hypothetical protein